MTQVTPPIPKDNQDRWLPEFRERAPWLGGDLQTLRTKVLGSLGKPFRVINTYPAQKVILPFDDRSGDSFSGILNFPARLPQKPLVVLIHGLTGTAESAYNVAAASYLLEQGYPVFRPDLRGAGGSRSLCKKHYHAGSSGDLAAILRVLSQVVSIKEMLKEGILLVGFSLGGNIVLKLLGEAGKSIHDQCQTNIHAIASVSAPIDLAAASKRIHEPRNLIYHRYLLERMKKEAFATPGGLSLENLSMIKKARTIYEFDDQYVALQNGFRGASDYYAQSSALRLLGSIQIPTLLIYALNDPWIPPDAYQELHWKDYQYLMPGLTLGGGHVGFHDAVSDTPWHNRVLSKFFDRIIEGGRI
ncbi:MAG: alpha/beta fold hydrolase [Alphaproteobacteria bacterium]